MEPRNQSNNTYHNQKESDQRYNNDGRHKNNDSRQHHAHYNSNNSNNNHNNNHNNSNNGHSNHGRPNYYPQPPNPSHQLPPNNHQRPPLISHQPAHQSSHNRHPQNYHNFNQRPPLPHHQNPNSQRHHGHSQHSGFGSNQHQYNQGYNNNYNQQPPNYPQQRHGYPQHQAHRDHHYASHKNGHNYQSPYNAAPKPHNNYSPKGHPQQDSQRPPANNDSRNQSNPPRPQSSRVSDPPRRVVHPPAIKKPSMVAWGSRCVDIFVKEEQIGEGTYGKVYKAHSKETRETVALKKIRMDNEKEGFPITAIREIKLLKKMKHDNVIRLKEIVTSTATRDKNLHRNQRDAEREKESKLPSIYMVFEYMDHDLTGLMMGSKIQFTMPQIKSYFNQLLAGLYYCQKQGILHRDLKGSNLLLNNDGVLKIADFGLARSSEPSKVGQYTNRVITLWYRPPELLLGASQYGFAVDMWSAGCILAEMLLHKAIFPGKTEQDQLQLIWQGCGTPTEQSWPEAFKLPFWNTFKPKKVISQDIKQYLTRIADQQRRFVRDSNEDIKKSFQSALVLVEKLLTLDPTKRLTAKQAMTDEFLFSLPDYKANEPLPERCRRNAWHEFEAKQRSQTQHTINANDPYGGAGKRVKVDNPPYRNPPHAKPHHYYK